MRISDWSSDVCSSDLRVLIPLGALLAIIVAFLLLRTPDTDRAAMIAKYGGAHAAFAAGPAGQRIHYRDQGARDGPVMQIGRAACRDRAGQYVSIAVVAGSLKKKTNEKSQKKLN